MLTPKQIRQAIRDAQKHLQTTPNAESRLGLVRFIVRWQKILRNVNGGHKKTYNNRYKSL